MKAALDKYKKDLARYRTYLANKHSYDAAIELCVWKYEKFLPALCPSKLFGANMIAYYLPGDPIQVNTGSTIVEMVCVPYKTEAFGLLMWENCLERYKALHKYEKAHPGKAHPTYNPKKLDALQFKARWSDYGSGKGQVSQWDEEAKVYLKQFEEAVLEWGG